VADVVGPSAEMRLPSSLGATRRWGWGWLSQGFRGVCLLLMLAVAATLPIVQWGALGYLLEVSRRRAVGGRWQDTLPGLEVAGRLGVVALGLFLTWLPVGFSMYFAYQAELIDPHSPTADRWRAAAGVSGIAWLIHAVWAWMRGGRFKDFLWPAPLRFFKEFFRPASWLAAEDRLWETAVQLHLPRLIWLGLRASVGAWLWLAVPATLMVIGMQANDSPWRAVVGAAGFLAMGWVLLYLPFLQTQLAVEGRMGAMFDRGGIRQAFQRAPWAFFLGLSATLLLAIPLYLLRIETLPPELLWLPCLVFVLFSLPARIVSGWALHRGRRFPQPRAWWSRYAAWLLQLAILPGYLFFLYLGPLATWDGFLILYWQHAFLPPVPFFR
jgi:hypothetical protein